MKKRIVITGMGTINPLGNSVDLFWDAVKAGKSGIDHITRLDTSGLNSKIAGEVKNFDPKEYIESKEAKKLDRFVQYALAATIQAMNDANLKPGDIQPERMGVVLGNGIGGLETLENSFEIMFARGPKRIPILTIPKLISNIAPGNIAIHFNAQGPAYTVVTACSSATDAIGDAARWIQNGTTDIMITGGSEAAITMMGIGGFCVIQALSTKFNDVPQKASRPFDKDRDGFVMAEGAGILVLEEYEHALKRGARIHAELSGYGISCDAYHITAPHPEGVGAVRAMNMALNDAGIQGEEIDYINAHGTSTPINDPTETGAIKQVFKEHAHKLKVSSTKSMTGHLVGAAGGVEAIICAQALKEQYYPPTINLDEADEKCDLDYVPNKGYNGAMRYTMSNSLGFGGHNGILILKRYEELR